jgi:hypothetical protein
VSGNFRNAHNISAKRTAWCAISQRKM